MGYTIQGRELFRYLQEGKDNEETMTSLHHLQTLSMIYVMIKEKCIQRLTR